MGLYFEGVCSKLTSSWPPARVKGGWELPAKSHFTGIRGICGIRGIGGRVPRGHFFCAGIVLESHLLGIGRPIFVKNVLYAPRQPKATPMATQSSPKWSKGCPKGPKKSSKSAQGEKKESKGTQRRPRNHKTIYTQTKYTQTPDPPPYSGRLVPIIYYLLYIAY